MHGNFEEGSKGKDRISVQYELEGKVLQEWKDLSQCLVLGSGLSSENKHTPTRASIGISSRTQTQEPFWKKRRFYVREQADKLGNFLDAENSR